MLGGTFSILPVVNTYSITITRATPYLLHPVLHLITQQILMFISNWPIHQGQVWKPSQLWGGEVLAFAVSCKRTSPVLLTMDITKSVA